MRHLLDPSHVRPRQGRAFGYELKHPVARSLAEGVPVRVWWQGREVSKPAGSRREVEEGGGGLVCFEPPYVWLSLPGDVDPAAAGEVLLDVPLPEVEVGSVAEARPLLMVCQQRSGSTALLYALGEAGPYRGPLQLGVGTETEGYWLWQSLREVLAHPLWSPFGDEARGLEGQTGSTGLLVRSGFLEQVLRESALQIHRTYSQASNTRGTWIDKSPGYEVVPVAPLFAALFPRGRLLYLSRDPVSCVLSGLRLEGRAAGNTRGPRALRHAAEVAARWCVSHHLWRRWCRPWLLPESFLEIRATEMREQGREVLSAVCELLDLETSATELERVLQDAPVPIHQARDGEYTAGVQALIANLCRAEAAAWGYEQPATSSATAVLLRPWFRRRVRQMLEYVGLAQGAAQTSARWLAIGGPEPARPAPPGAMLASWLLLDA